MERVHWGPSLQLRVVLVRRVPCTRICRNQLMTIYSRQGRV